MFSACSSKDSSSKDSSINQTPSTPAKEDVFDLQQNDLNFYGSPGDMTYLDPAKKWASIRKKVS